MEAIRYRLPRHVFLGVQTRFCVFLDAAHDRYLAVKYDEFAALGPWLEGWIGPNAGCDSRASPSPQSRQFAADLCRRGILTTAKGEGKPVLTEKIITATKGATADYHRVSAPGWLRHGVRFLLATARTRQQFKTGSFESIMRDMSACRARSADSSHVDLQHERYLVSIFEVCRAFYSRPFVCLFDSVCLFNFLAQYSFYPRLVFGVMSEPFRAHCWLQEGEAALNDSVERVRAYAPIMCV